MEVEVFDKFVIHYPFLSTELFKYFTVEARGREGLGRIGK
jgi:hypothetical protein